MCCGHEPLRPPASRGQWPEVCVPPHSTSVNRHGAGGSLQGVSHGREAGCAGEQARFSQTVWLLLRLPSPHLSPRDPQQGPRSLHHQGEGARSGHPPQRPAGGSGALEEAAGVSEGQALSPTATPFQRALGGGLGVAPAGAEATRVAVQQHPGCHALSGQVLALGAGTQTLPVSGHVPQQGGRGSEQACRGKGLTPPPQPTVT